jgi:ABC-type glycerol-3-phosphate transport system permease component
MNHSAAVKGKRLALHLVLLWVTIVTVLPVALVVRKAFTPGQEFALTLNPIPDTLTLEHFRHVMGRTLPDGTWIFGRQLSSPWARRSWAFSSPAPRPMPSPAFASPAAASA